MTGHKLAVVLRQTRSAFGAKGFETADLDARLIVEHFSGTTRVEAISNPDRVLAPEVCDAIDKAVARRLAGEPVHRILGFREFYGLKLVLSPETLEPRPDTETLVDAVLPAVRRFMLRNGNCRILDLGTGTGAVALALLNEVPGTEAVGVDISRGALETASANARHLGLESRFYPQLGSWFETIDGAFNVIVSNPPYIRRTDIGDLDSEVRDFDPISALDGGYDGLDAYRAIAEGAPHHLARQGIVAVEIGFDQADDCREIFARNDLFFAQKHKDMGAKDRVLVFSREKSGVLRA